MDWIDTAISNFTALKPWGQVHLSKELAIDLHDAIRQAYAPEAEKVKALLKAVRNDLQWGILVDEADPSSVARNDDRRALETAYRAMKDGGS